MAKAITVEGLSKAYQLGDFGTGTISRDVERFIARIRGKEDPYLRIGETNDRTQIGESDIVWCLKDLNFDIEQGDAVGIIGRNGAGKSTLLKILSRITSPTTGSIKIKGRVASLLEVGTGFSPELTGRENIYLNGAILGMRKSEIRRRFDEILDFSGVERYIDTPVKRYSSGMYVRLAFAVAAHLESEILIVDEVLAVGDAEFQKKCLGKMGDIRKGEGRTVLFVSHNMGAIENLCTRAVVLNNGELFYNGDVHNAINYYVNLENNELSSIYHGDKIIREAEITATHNDIAYQSNLTLNLKFDSDILFKDVVLGIIIKDVFDNPLISINNKHYKKYVSICKNKTNGVICLEMNQVPLFPGNYKIDLFLGDQIVDLEVLRNAIQITIPEREGIQTSYPLDFISNKFYLQDVSWTLINK